MRAKRRAPGRASIGLGALFLLVLAPRLARADVSSWMFVGAGPSWTQQGDERQGRQLSLQLDTGLGTPPSGTVIVGGLGRMQTHFSEGTDLGLYLRTATHGFVNGDFGVAIDIGATQRWWNSESSLITGSLVLGAPWGITVVGTGGRGTNDGRLYSVVLGVDLARLTVYRRTGETWWRNPFPAYRPEEE